MSTKRGLGSIPRGLEWINKTVAPESVSNITTEPLPQLSSEPASVSITSSSTIVDTRLSTESLVTQSVEKTTEKKTAQKKPVNSSLGHDTNISVATKPVTNDNTTILEQPAEYTKIVATQDSGNLSNSVQQAVLSELQEGWTRATFIIRSDQLTTIKAFAYWERLTVKEVLEEVLDFYFKDKQVLPIPQRRGRISIE